LNSFFCFSISSAVLRAALATFDEDWNQVQALDKLRRSPEDLLATGAFCPNAVP
jgi:hypothetical protein